MLTILCQGWFTGALAFNLAWAAAMCKVTTLCRFKKSTAQGLSCMIVKVAWAFSIIFSPWVKCVGDSSDDAEWTKVQAKVAVADSEAAQGPKAAKPLFILANHTSFFDTVMFASMVCPAWVLWKLRTFMDSALFELPLLGTICRSIGHFPVYFKSAEDGKFSVDKEKTAEVDKRVDEHLVAGGWLCYFPEGTINKDPDQLLVFRLGSMRKALDFDARVAFCVFHNCQGTWGRRSKAGGMPATIRHSTRFVAPDGVKAYVATIRERPDLPAEEQGMSDAELLAKYLRIQMQSQYDELKSAAGGSTKKIN